MRFPCDVFNFKERDAPQISIIVRQSNYHPVAQDTANLQSY